MDDRLWSERRGGTLGLTRDGYHKLVELFLKRCSHERLFEEALGIGRSDIPGAARGRHHPDEFFTYRLGDPWPAEVLRMPGFCRYESDDRLFDLFELLHREVVSYPLEPDYWPTSGFDQEEGRRRFAEGLNRILERRDPPLEIDSTGTILQRVGEPFRRLVEQPLPDEAPKIEVTDRVGDAVAHFRRRDATAGDRRAAVRELVDVLEFLRKDVKEHMLTEDERALFRLANEFPIRHNKRETRRDFDDPAWLAWAFYVYMATIRLTLDFARRSRTAKT